MSLHHLQFINAAALGGLRIDTVTEGKLMRVKADGDKGGKRSGAYRYFGDSDNPSGIWWNWKNGAMGTWVARERMSPTESAAHRERIRLAKIEREAEQARQWQVNAIKNHDLFAGAHAITVDDPVALYLAGRGLPIPDTTSMRFEPALEYWDDGKLLGLFPAMLAAVAAPSGEVVAIHRTYLTWDGRKADVPTVKKLTGTSGPIAGAAIRLGRPQTRPDGQPGLAVAEGIETALAVTAMHGIGCWAAVSAHGLQSFQWPAEVKNLYVMGDNDASGTGQDAAERLAKHAAGKGLTARVHIPETVGQDWADVLMDQSRQPA
ncbi:toprim domain protein [Bordetella bronchiseptica MBORD678]|uniref:DUF7146 domain-containing protein n=1 Tax=Bordetella bronchiseptica TaxID=518 RepID=UPI0004A02A78|nr:toprim domain-containing protein [Bordetella bronchiseptica]KDD84075.1 toprim domain protein [Bordetella bronchiseptica MBORD678]